MKKPDTNLLPAAQPWGRWVDDAIAEGKSSDANLQGQIDSLMNGDGGQATAIANLQALLARYQFELEFLYTATGTPYPPSSSPPAPEEPVAVAPTTIEVTADWSRTWGGSTYYTGSGEYTNAVYLYQGQNPENKVGMWHYNVGAAAGRTITDAAIFLQNVNAPYSSTFVAQFGTHGNASPPTGKPGRQNAFDVGWSRGEGKWAPVPSWAWDGLSNGSIQGFTVGAAGASDPNSAYFMGVGAGSPPRLRLTYT